MIAATVQRTVRERALLSAGDHVLVGCSGGADSTALLHVLHRLRNDLGVTLCAASIDHGLRPESSGEVEKVGAFAALLGVSFVPGRVEVPREGPSVQARARTLRYQALRQIAASQSATCIAVGHTRDDQAETVLARLLRGAGVRGLSGIEARRADGVIRPLLDCRREDVRAYVLERQLPFVEDPSNHQRAFERVRLRHEILPTLLNEDPRLVEHLADLSDEVADLNDFLDTATPVLPPPGVRTVSLEMLQQMPPPLRIRWIRAWIARESGLTPGRSHLREVGRLLTGPGEVLLGSGWSVRRSTDGLSLEYREHRRTRSHRS
jgi:tRNA(Ile)-lysidine synthase